MLKYSAACKAHLSAFPDSYVHTPANVSFKRFLYFFNFVFGVHHTHTSLSSVKIMVFFPMKTISVYHATDKLSSIEEYPCNSIFFGILYYHFILLNCIDKLFLSVIFIYKTSRYSYQLHCLLSQLQSLGCLLR